VERPAVQLDDEPLPAPHEIGLDTRDLPVQRRHRQAGVAQELERAHLRRAPREVHRETRVAGQDALELATPPAPAEATRERVHDVDEGRRPQADRLPDATGEDAVRDVRREVEQGAWDGGHGDAVDRGDVLIQEVAAVHEDPVEPAWAAAAWARDDLDDARPVPPSVQRRRAEVLRTERSSVSVAASQRARSPSSAGLIA
jgi:hypothetical protein